MTAEVEPEETWVSTFVPLAPAVPLLPRECARPLLRLHPDGGWERLPPPALPDLFQHAERFGTECVAETAAETMGEESLTSLIARLDVIAMRRGEREAAARGRRTRPPKTKPADVRARALLGIPEEEETE